MTRTISDNASTMSATTKTAKASKARSTTPNSIDYSNSQTAFNLSVDETPVATPIQRGFCRHPSFSHETIDSSSSSSSSSSNSNNSSSSITLSCPRTQAGRVSPSSGGVSCLCCHATGHSSDGEASDHNESTDWGWDKHYPYHQCECFFCGQEFSFSAPPQCKRELLVMKEQQSRNCEPQQELSPSNRFRSVKPALDRCTVINDSSLSFSSLSSLPSSSSSDSPTITPDDKENTQSDILLLPQQQQQQKQINDFPNAPRRRSMPATKQQRSSQELTHHSSSSHYCSTMTPAITALTTETPRQHASSSSSHDVKRHQKKKILLPQCCCDKQSEDEKHDEHDGVVSHHQAAGRHSHPQGIHRKGNEKERRRRRKRHKEPEYSSNNNSATYAKVQCNDAVDHGDEDEEDLGTPLCKTGVVIDRLSFQWDVSGFYKLRSLAALRALPSKDRLISRHFGSSRTGVWHLALFPYGERETHRYVSVYLFSDDVEKQRVAAFRVSLLNQLGNEIEGTALEESVRVFTPDHHPTSSARPEGASWGWHEYLAVPTEEEFQRYLIKPSDAWGRHSSLTDTREDGDGTLSIRATVVVYSAIEEVVGPRHMVDMFYQSYHQESIPSPRAQEHMATRTLQEPNIYRCCSQAPHPYNNPLQQQPTSFISHLRQMHPTALQKLNNAPTKIMRIDSYRLMPFNFSMTKQQTSKRMMDARHSCATAVSEWEETNSFVSMTTGHRDNRLHSIRDRNDTVDSESQNHHQSFNRHTNYGAKLSDDIGWLLASCPEETRDIQLIASPDRGKVLANRFILASRSSVLRSIVYSRHFSRGQQEEHTGKNHLSIQIPIEAPQSVVQAFVDYLETDQCSLLKAAASDGQVVACIRQHSPPSTKEDEEDADEDADENEEDSCREHRYDEEKAMLILLHVLQLWILSDFYLVDKLYCDCVKALVRMVNSDTAMTIHRTAAKLRCGPLLDATHYILHRTSKHNRYRSDWPK